MYTELYNAIATTIADAKDLPLEDINEQTTISELELDSLDYVELMVMVKKDFNIAINFEETMKSNDITLKEFCVSILPV